MAGNELREGRGGRGTTDAGTAGLALATRISYDDAGHRIAEEYRDGQGTLTGRRTWTYAGDDVLSDQIDDLADTRWVRTTYRYDDGRPVGDRAACIEQPSRE